MNLFKATREKGGEVGGGYKRDDRKEEEQDRNADAAGNSHCKNYQELSKTNETLTKTSKK